MKLPPDEAYALRMALEPSTHKAEGAGGNDLYLASIAISLKRIADVMESQNVTRRENARALGEMLGLTPKQ